MQETLRRIHAKRTTGDHGFTLIELLVVVVIIGVLAGISVPLYMNYTKGAKNKTAQSDVRNAITAVEEYYSENNAYPDSFNASSGNTVKTSVSTGNTLGIKNNGTSYVICGKNADGDKVYKYDSSAGGSVKEDTSSSVSACLG
ncbi:prepilin-type N-terminal cleavage/methylation domain-containing protein [Planosporangium thailandense]|uniref:Prepilin-type N-terminal cleavage/methylation domain-containing protein n=1 Tax=Planosporangium thailandense TaxID=765197 RepID=A0ABX0YAE4_9ACTN|nr:prepilin-type N-terminal cleavage/methylation domain-containing protein [Planosporangium thailandense]NJC74199.1 prepilin-type N-terminal cleavage/methylation domain-containing protein [Planosporangium thailandense]